MAPPCPFLALPREIRDAIYEHYVAIPSGYVCDPGRFAASVLERNATDVRKINIAGLLKGANDQPIDLNLSYTCRLIATEIVAGMHDFGGMAKDPSEFWDIPQYSRLQAMAAYWTHGEDTDRIEDVITKKDRVKHRFSAAAAAVFFMKSCDRALRMQLRKIIVHEDRTPVGHPARHAQGLIPFCQENPLLVVERRVDLWRNAIQSEPHHRRDVSHPMDAYHTYRRDWVIESQGFSESILSWIVEALALAPAGMPVKSFSLIPDAEPASHLMTQMFQAIVQHDAAWQQAWDESVKRGIIKEPSWLGGRWRIDWYPSYTVKHLPQALRDIAEEKSVVRCNFDIGEPWDFERFVREHKGWSHANWARGWGKEHERKNWETESPLPSWKSILEENLLPVPDDHVHYGDSDRELFDF
ncbi:hypothetical protein CKAH01_09402 [Colletotrichum kahawae]|uniref:Uncharacterized protein n=1 Tax=Colletotrichum kahawae TaxID=34407 RepID=A0AAE0D0F9_COLKA|nr:hypothetical protein CKAH01_09402 [Colletotrichum kahawae]